MPTTRTRVKTVARKRFTPGRAQIFRSCVEVLAGVIVSIIAIVCRFRVWVVNTRPFQPPTIITTQRERQIARHDEQECRASVHHAPSIF